MARITFRQDRCKGCRLCSAVCPRGIIVMSDEINEMGYHPAIIKAKEKCTGCTLCAIVCPDLVIEVEREEKVV